MHPVLFDLGFATIGTYGFALVLAFLSAIWLAVQGGKASGSPPPRILGLSFSLLLGAILGAKLLLLIVDWRALL